MLDAKKGSKSSKSRNLRSYPNTWNPIWGLSIFSSKKFCDQHSITFLWARDRPRRRQTVGMLSQKVNPPKCSIFLLRQSLIQDPHSLTTNKMRRVPLILLGFSRDFEQQFWCMQFWLVMTAIIQASNLHFEIPPSHLSEQLSLQLFYRALLVC